MPSFAGNAVADVRVNVTNLNIHEEDVYRELQKWKRRASP